MRHGIHRKLVELVTSLIATIALTGCPQSPPTALAVLSLDINDGAGATGSRTVILNNTCQGSPTEYLASESSGFDRASWQPYSNHPSFVLSPGHGLKHIYFKVRNAKQISPLATESVTLTLFVVPEVTSFTVNGGAASAPWQTVTMNSICSGDPTDFMASESAAFEGAAWQSYNAMLAFILSNGNGAKTIYFKVRNFDSESDTASSTISLAELGAAPPVNANNGLGLLEARAVSQTSDRGSIVVGAANSASGNDWDIYLGKTNDAGGLTWQTTFAPGWMGLWEGGVEQAADGGYILTGTFWNDHPMPIAHMGLIKTDAVGNMQWQSEFDGFGYSSGGNVVRRTADGGYIVGGGTSAGEQVPMMDAFLVKTDTAGRLQWQSTFDGLGVTTDIHDLRQTRDGGYICVGITESSADYQLYLDVIKTNALGRRVWERTLSGSAESAWPRVQQTSDGGYIVITTFSINATRYLLHLIKMDASGGMMWQRTYPGVGTARGSGVLQTSDGGYIVVGTTVLQDDSRIRMYVLRTDTTGAIVWQNTFVGLGLAAGADICPTLDGNYVVCGATWSSDVSNPVFEEAYLVKIDAAGNQVW